MLLGVWKKYQRRAFDSSHRVCQDGRSHRACGRHFSILPGLPVD